MKIFIRIIIVLVLGIFVLKACSSSNKYEPTPVDKLIKELEKEQNISIILEDMTAHDLNSSAESYKHKYKILKERNDTILVEETDWKTVSPYFFKKHIDDLGMEIAFKKNG